MISRLIAAALGAFLLSACMAEPYDVRVTGISAGQNLDRILVATNKFVRARHCRGVLTIRNATVDTGRGRGISKRHSVTSRPGVALLGGLAIELAGVTTSRINNGC